jgi:predicted MFS family arabinose efflux permease
MKERPNLQLGALIGIGVVSVAVLQLLPMLVGGLVDHRGFSERQAAYVASMEFGAIALSTLSALYWLHRIAWVRVAAAGMAVLVVGNLATVFITDFHAFASIRGVTGLASGCCMTLALTGIGQTARADRNFGLFVSAQLLFASIALWGLPYLFKWLGVNAAYGLLCLLAFIVLSILVRWIPSDRINVELNKTGGTLIVWIPALFILAAVFSFNIAQSAFWAFIERIGNFGGLNPRQTGVALGIAALGGLSGALTATWINTRFGRLLPLAAALLIQLTVLAVLKGELTLGFFALLATVYYFSWNLTIPYQFGLLAEFDRDGRAIVFCSFLVSAGLSIGPALVGQTLTGENYISVNWIAAAFCVVSYSLLLPALAAARKQPSADVVRSVQNY